MSRVAACGRRCPFLAFLKNVPLLSRRRQARSQANVRPTDSNIYGDFSGTVCPEDVLFVASGLLTRFFKSAFSCSSTLILARE